MSGSKCTCPEISGWVLKVGEKYLKDFDLMKESIDLTSDERKARVYPHPTNAKEDFGELCCMFPVSDLKVLAISPGTAEYHRKNTCCCRKENKKMNEVILCLKVVEGREEIAVVEHFFGSIEEFQEVKKVNSDGWLNLYAGSHEDKTLDEWKDWMMRVVSILESKRQLRKITQGHDFDSLKPQDAVDHAGNPDAIDPDEPQDPRWE